VRGEPYNIVLQPSQFSFDCLALALQPPMLEGKRMGERKYDPLIAYLFDLAIKRIELGAECFQPAHNPRSFHR
jgi:hypothetical protein